MTLSRDGRLFTLTRSRLVVLCHVSEEAAHGDTAIQDGAGAGLLAPATYLRHLARIPRTGAPPAGTGEPQPAGQGACMDGSSVQFAPTICNRDVDEAHCYDTSRFSPMFLLAYTVKAISCERGCNLAVAQQTLQRMDVLQYICENLKISVLLIACELRTEYPGLMNLECATSRQQQCISERSGIALLQG